MILGQKRPDLDGTVLFRGVRILEPGDPWLPRVPEVVLMLTALLEMACCGRDSDRIP